MIEQEKRRSKYLRSFNAHLDKIFCKGDICLDCALKEAAEKAYEVTFERQQKVAR